MKFFLIRLCTGVLKVPETAGHKSIFDIVEKNNNNYVWYFVHRTGVWLLSIAQVLFMI